MAIAFDVHRPGTYGDAEQICVDWGYSCLVQEGPGCAGILFAFRATGLAFPKQRRQRGASMADETYDQERARRLEGLLRALSDRIRELDARASLLANATELMRLVGDVKSELFHYEVRATYDTPEVAESRRIIQDVKKESENTWQKSEWHPDKEKPPEW